MRIKEILSQHRRDFRAIFECDHCGHETKEMGGYDDANYHDNVVPEFRCPECGKKAGEDYEPRTPKYPEGQTI